MQKAAGFTNTLQQPVDKKWLLLLLIVLFIPHWIAAYHIVQSSIAPDLLLRTIGSRLQQSAKPIYEYKWKAGDPIGWLNPYPDNRAGVNGVVSTPFTLKLLQPLANLNYCSIKVTWSFIEEALLFATTFLCCLIFKNRLSNFVFIAVATAFFVYDRNWSLHLYNGQMYVLYAFIFSFCTYLLSTSRKQAIPIILVLLSPIRPFLITAILPFLRFQKKHIIWLGMTIMITIFLVFIATSVNEWRQYNRAMQVYSKEQTNELTLDPTAPVNLTAVADACTLNKKHGFTNFGAGCLYSLQHYLYLLHIGLSNTNVYELTLALLLAALYFLALKNDWVQDNGKQFLLAFLFYELCSLLTPAFRNPYSMIEWLPAVAWLIASKDKKIIFLVLVGLCLNHDIPFRFAYERELGEMLLFVSVVVFLFQKPTPNKIIL